MSRGKKIIVSIAVVFLLIFGAVVWAVAWCYTAKPTPRTDYGAKIRELAAKDAPNPENRDRYPEFVAIVEAVGNAHAAFREQAEAAGKRDDIKYERVIRGTATAEERSLADEALAFVTASGAFGRCKRLPGLRGALRTIPTGEPLLGTPLYEISFCRVAGHLQVLRLRRALEADDSANALAAAREILAMTDILAQQGSMLDASILFRTRRLLYDAMAQACDDGLVSGVSARELVALLSDYALTPTSARAVSLERYIGLDMIQWTYTDNGRGDGLAIMTEIKRLDGSDTPPKLDNIAAFVMPSGKEAEEHMSTSYDALVGFAA
ncbi:MAG TPA: hypothetical protein VD971_11510 [Phycisphaerales bacterium]|nr:hypothetical protein [Phycisphaerales bacterium]